MQACKRQIGGKCCRDCEGRHAVASSKVVAVSEGKMKVFLALSSDSSEAFCEAVRELKSSDFLRRKCRFLGQNVPRGGSTPTDFFEWRLGEIAKCDLLVILLEGDLSRMFSLVIGAAASQGKRVLVLTPRCRPIVDLDLAPYGEVREYGSIEEVAGFIQEVVTLPLYESSMHETTKSQAEAGGLFATKASACTTT